MRSSGDKKVHGGVHKNRPNKNNKQNIDKKTKAAAPTAYDLDNELLRYMGGDAASKKLNDELDSYFATGNEGESA